jgi:uncharacterized membrane protein YczE
MTDRARWVRRFGQLQLGLVFYGVSAACQIQSGLGLDPWDVFHQGLALRADVQIGTMVIIVSGAVLLLWIPLRQRPGLGTVCSMFVVGLSINVGLAVVGQAHHVVAQAMLLAAGIVGSALGCALSISAGFGPGPRDGLMTGLAARTPLSIRQSRTLVEAVALVAGYFMGGTVGVGTVVYVITIGPLTQLFLELWTPSKSR